MGRFYWGDIEGKFWFGIQDSDDICNLINIKYISTYSWKCCDCGTYADINYDTYCSNCYDTYEEHKQAIHEDEYGSDYDDVEISEKLYYQNDNISYEIYKDEHYFELLNSLKDLELQLSDRVIREFANIDYDDKLLNTFEKSFEKTEIVFKEEVKNGLLDKSKTVILARYILGTQIKFCLEKNGHCIINCEC